MGVQMSIFDLDLSFGKMSQELSQATEGKILEPCWKNFVESKKTTFQFLCLTADVGRIAEQSSATACEGILRRADKRGKELPEVLKTALENQITRTPSKSGGGSDTYIKPDGSIGTAGKGALIQTEQSATLGVSQDQTLFTPTTAYGLGRDSFNSGTNAQFTMSIEEETQPPITERGAGGVCSITQ